jgi:hypothetical protein
MQVHRAPPQAVVDMLLAVVDTAAANAGNLDPRKQAEGYATGGGANQLRRFAYARESKERKSGRRRISDALSNSEHKVLTFNGIIHLKDEHENIFPENARLALNH